MKKVLITGIEGFTGKHLSPYLKKNGYDVYGTSLRYSDDKIYKCDITDEENILHVLKLVKPDFIIHLAGISFVADEDIINVYKINTIGSLNLLSSVDKLGLNPTKILLSSSATVYGNQGLELLDESLQPKPANHYFMSKYAVERLAENYFDKLNIIVTRPFNYTGIGQDENFLIPKIVKHFKENKRVIELGNLDVSREFNDISYVCEAYKKLLECEKKSEVVNIASNRGIKLLDVIDIMNKISNYNIEVKVNPAFVRKNEIKSLTGSAVKLFGMIGYIKQKEFKDTLVEMYEN